MRPKISENLLDSSWESQGDDLDGIKSNYFKVDDKLETLTTKWLQSGKNTT